MLLGFFISLVVVLLLAAGVLAWGLVKLNSIDRVDVELAKVAKADPQNFLVVGSDTRSLKDEKGADQAAIFGDGDEAEPAGQRADTMIVVRVDPKRTTLEVLSLPRDLLVTIAGGSKRSRLNSAYNAGPQKLVDTIEQNLGIEIHHYVEVNFSGFKGIVEAIDGVPMYFDRPVRDRYTGLNIIAKGCYNLSPQQALAFARSRHLEYLTGRKWSIDGTADMGRITRQQTFLRRALAKVSTLGITDFNKLRKLVDVAVNSVKIDDALSFDQMLALARRFSKFDAKTLVTHRLPANPERVGGASVLTIDEAAAAGVLDIFRGVAQPTSKPPPPESEEAPIVAAAVTVDVRNGTKRNLLASNAGEDLAAIGFNLGEIESLPEQLDGTRIRYGEDGSAAAVLVASHIVPTPTMVEDSTLSGTHVALDLGADFDAVSSRQVAPTSPSVTGGAPVTTTTVPEADKDIGFSVGDPPPGIDCPKKD